MKNILSKAIKAVFLALIFAAASVYAASFVGPSGTPSTYNAALPVNVSANNQFKQGGLGMSSLLIGPGTTLPGATNASILGKLGVGPGLDFSSMSTGSISATGFVSAARGVWTPANYMAGLNALVNPPTAAGPSGSVIAEKFCFSGVNGACINTWPTGSTGGATLPAGTLGQTLFYAAAGTAVTPTSTVSISGTNATINGVGMATSPSDTWARFTVDNGGLHVKKNGTDALFLYNTAGGASSVSVISNVAGLNFWSTDNGGHNTDIYVRDVMARDTIASRNVKGADIYGSNLANSSTSNVCADGVGKLVLCTGSGPGTSNPTSSMQVYNLGSGSVQQTSGTLGSSAPGSFTVPAGVTQIAVDVIGAGGGATNGAYAGGGAGRSYAFINVTPGQTYTVSIGRNGARGTCATNSDGGQSSFTGNGYTMFADGGNKAGCSAHGTGGNGLSGTGSTNLLGRTGNYNGGGYGGDPASCTPSSSSACANYNIAGFGRGGDASAYDGAGGLVVVMWANPNTTGSPVLVSGGGANQTVSFTTAGAHTWVVPAGVTSMDIEVIGAGGGGSGSYNTQGGNAGGGGGYFYRANIAVAPGQSYSMSVGAGGTKGLSFGSGTDGAATSFAGTYVANGGTGGTINGGGGAPGTGGTAAGPGGSAITGANGGAGMQTAPYTGGVGGYSGGGPSYTAGKGGNGGLGNTNAQGTNGAAGAVVITYR